MGITDFAQSQLGDIVFVDIQTEGEDLSEGEVFGAIAAVKTVADAIMPISGKFVAVKADLEGPPETVIPDPSGYGWMIQVDMSHPAELDKLFVDDARSVYCK